MTIKMMTGMKFGKLTIIESTRNHKNEKAWKCKCSCGRERIVITALLKNGSAKACGCTHGKNRLKHGMHKEKVYNSWRCMMSRCYRERDQAFKDYGGRGIKVCNEWHNPQEFKNWALKNGFEEGLTIDRIDGNKGYKPSNCEWITRPKNSQKTRNSKKVEFNGVMAYVPEHAERQKLKKGTIYKRLQNGWTVEEALSTPPGEKRCRT